jgi:hypothetical protein
MVKWVPEPVAIDHEVERVVSPAYYTAEGGLADPNSILNLKMKTLAMQPKVFVIEDFLSADECDHIIKEADESGEMKRSAQRINCRFVHVFLSDRRPKHSESYKSNFNLNFA